MMKNMGKVTQTKTEAIARTLTHVKRVKAWADKKEEGLKAELREIYNSYHWPESKDSSKYLEFEDSPDQNWDSIVCELISDTTSAGKPKGEGRLAVRKDAPSVSIDVEKFRELVGNDEDFLKAIKIIKIDVIESEIDKMLEEERFTRDEFSDLISEGAEKYVVNIYKKKV